MAWFDGMCFVEGRGLTSLTKCVWWIDWAQESELWYAVCGKH